MGNGKGLTWLFAATIIIALGVLFAYLKPRAPEPSEGSHKDTALSSRSRAQAQTAAQAEPTAAPVSAAHSAWVVTDPESVDRLPTYKEVVPGRALVKVSEALRLGMAGLKIALEVPQIGQTFDGVVERLETDPYGNVSYIGLLTEPDGSDYRFVITAGARNTFARVGTSRGAFELVASDGLGWLMPAANMDQHVDYSKPDYFIRGERLRDED